MLRERLKNEVSNSPPPPFGGLENSGIFPQMKMRIVNICYVSTTVTKQRLLLSSLQPIWSREGPEALQS